MLQSPQVDIKLRSNRANEECEHVVSPEMFGQLVKINKLNAYNMIKNKIEMERQRLVLIKTAKYAVHFFS